MGFTNSFYLFLDFGFVQPGFFGAEFEMDQDNFKFG